MLDGNFRSLTSYLLKVIVLAIETNRKYTIITSKWACTCILTFDNFVTRPNEWPPQPSDLKQFYLNLFFIKLHIYNLMHLATPYSLRQKCMYVIVNKNIHVQSLEKQLIMIISL